MKNVVIMGASGTIGKALVKKFYNSGFNVFGSYFNNKNELDNLSAGLKVRQNRFCYFYCDQTSEKSVKEFFNEFAKIFGKIDCLICSAGVSKPNLIIDQSFDNLSREINVNLIGTILVNKESLNYFSDFGGSIINIASIWGNVGASFESTYSATKGGVIAFSKSLAKEIGSKNITVNTISPGLIISKMNSHLTKADIALVKEESAINKLPTALSVAKTALFLTKSPHITGTNITIDCGFTL